jgi:heme/copper-type cytochrome/quinol oxidase subunit 3
MTRVLGDEREPMKTISEARETLFTTFSDDWGSDITTLKGVPWGKAMMWVFLLSDTFIFTCFLVGYMSVRMSTVGDTGEYERIGQQEHPHHCLTPWNALKGGDVGAPVV